MKTRYILIAVAMLVVSACAKSNEQPKQEVLQITIHAYQEDDHTKTTVLDGGTQVYWEPSDEIKVFFKGSGSRFISQNTAEATVADFSGSLNILVGANEGVSSTTKIFGLYPYRSDATSDGSSVTTTLPAEQTGRAGSFAKNTHISLAATNANSVDLSFYNVTGGLRFSLTQEGIKSVTFEGNNGEALAGKIKLAFEGGLPAVKEVSEGESVLTLNAPGGSFQTNTWYYIETLPGTLTKGFNMIFSKGTETAKLSSSSSVTINRGRYGSIADVDAGLEFIKTGDNPSGNNIVFSDEKVKAELVAKFDTNSDGEISYEEASTVNSFDGVFESLKTGKSFDEFQFFTRVQEIPNYLFQNWTLLKSITLPASLKKIGRYAFYGCSSLRELMIPSDVYSIGDCCFMGCSSLSSMVIPEGVYVIASELFRGCTNLESIILPSKLGELRHSAFKGCSNLSSIVIPDGITSIEEGAFQDCYKLTTIAFPSTLTFIGMRAFSRCGFSTVYLPNTVKTIGWEAFSYCTNMVSISLSDNLNTIDYSAFKGCSSIVSIEIPDNVTELGSDAFAYCSKLTSVALPDGITNINSGVFTGCSSLTNILLPKWVSSIGESAFASCTQLISIEIPAGVVSIEREGFSNCVNLTSITVKPENPPQIGYLAFHDSSCPIYVPKQSVDMYKAATGWSGYADRIVALSEE